MKKPGWISLLFIWLLLIPTGICWAQEGRGPVYVVQPGDTLWTIAQRFGVSVDVLASYNGINDPGQLSADAELIIPGLTGLSGILTTQNVGYGETLRSLSRRYQTSEKLLARLNHIVSPNELYAGIELILPQSSQVQAGKERVAVGAGNSLLEMAVLERANPWALLKANSLRGIWAAIPGDILRVPGGADDEGPGALPQTITGIQVGPLPITQGKTVIFRVEAPANLSLSGSFTGHELHFFELGAGHYVALQGVHALTEPGFYSVTLQGLLPDGTKFDFSQLVYVRDGGYPYDPPLVVDPATIDPAVTKPEDEQWAALVTPVTAQRYWNGKFQTPSPLGLEYGFPSLFGNRRAYNGGTYDRFHGGLDMYGDTGTEILAPAAGQVVFTGLLTVRGNAISIDHGWGVYTGFMHLSEIKVAVGDKVEPGQLIGLAGGTGRVSGPHLHFEVWVGGVQVDPLDWLMQEYP